MEAKRLEHLISGYLSGSLTEAEAAELAETVRDSAEARSVAAKHLVLDRLMRAAGTEPVDADRVMRALGSQGSNGVADRVLERLGQEPSPTGRSVAHRISRRRTESPSRRGWWVSLLVAASVLVLLTLSVTQDKASRRIEKRPEKTAAAPAPEPEAPEIRVPDRVEPPADVRPPKEPVPPAEPLPGTPEPAPRPAPVPPPPAPAPERPEPAATVAALQATLIDQVEGEVFILAGASLEPAKAGQPLADGHGLRTSGKSRAVVKFADGTQVELPADSEIRDVLELRGGRGKRLFLASGALHARVEKQPKDRPLVFSTPHAESKVLGTTLRLVVDLSGKGSTRLEVTEGKVQLRRKSDGKTVEVTGGYQAVAGVGIELTPRRLRPADEAPRADGLPFDAACPVIYTNDGVADVWTDEYVMALASAGAIDLRGILTSTSEAPFNPYGSADDYRQVLLTRTHLVKAARNSGFRWLPDPVAGPLRHLEKPASGRIEETRPVGAPGSLLIVREARKATPQQPLVIASGGPVNAAADAWLLDPSIADKVVVACVGNSPGRYDGYASWCDPWAAWIVCQKLRVVYFPQLPAAQPAIAPEKFAELPESEFKRWLTLFRKAGGPKTDGDAPPALAVVRSDYVLRSKRASVSGTTPSGTPPREAPVFKDDPAGNVWVVLEVSGAVATEEWWRALKDPAAWDKKPK